MQMDTPDSGAVFSRLTTSRVMPELVMREGAFSCSP